MRACSCLKDRTPDCTAGVSRAAASLVSAELNALEHDERHGVLGRMSTRERQVLR